MVRIGDRELKALGIKRPRSAVEWEPVQTRSMTRRGKPPSDDDEQPPPKRAKRTPVTRTERGGRGGRSGGRATDSGAGPARTPRVRAPRPQHASSSSSAASSSAASSSAAERSPAPVPTPASAHSPGPSGRSQASPAPAECSPTPVPTPGPTHPLSPSDNLQASTQTVEEPSPSGTRDELDRVFASPEKYLSDGLNVFRAAAASYLVWHYSDRVLPPPHLILYSAIRERVHPDMIQQIIEYYQAEVDEQRQNGTTRGSGRVVDGLWGEDNNTSQPPLHFAIESGNKAAAVRLLEMGANPNILWHEPTEGDLVAEIDEVTKGTRYTTGCLHAGTAHEKCAPDPLPAVSGASSGDLSLETICRDALGAANHTRSQLLSDGSISANVTHSDFALTVLALLNHDDVLYPAVTDDRFWRLLQRCCFASNSLAMRNMLDPFTNGLIPEEPADFMERLRSLLMDLAEEGPDNNRFIIGYLCDTFDVLRDDDADSPNPALAAVHGRRFWNATEIMEIQASRNKFNHPIELFEAAEGGCFSGTDASKAFVAGLFECARTFGVFEELKALVTEWLRNMRAT